MTFRDYGTRGWLMEPDPHTSLDAWLNADRALTTRRQLAADPDPNIITQLIERGRTEP